ncbi:hypothetical protein AB3F25_07960 [Aggregatibacter sp. HMT-949]|uniref:hypothetical protein n=1 Tax=Aggregatibacter sp. HMT-949 TaxID=3235088 RepID=UPI00359C49D6
MWEIAIKSGQKEPNFEINVEKLEQGLLSVGCRQLPIELPHIVKSSNYPFICKNPFVRLLPAQADIENLYFMTTDRLIAEYAKPFILNAKK